MQHFLLLHFYLMRQGVLGTTSLMPILTASSHGPKIVLFQKELLCSFALAETLTWLGTLWLVSDQAVQPVVLGEEQLASRGERANLPGRYLASNKLSKTFEDSNTHSNISHRRNYTSPTAGYGSRECGLVRQQCERASTIRRSLGTF